MIRAKAEKVKIEKDIKMAHNVIQKQIDSGKIKSKEAPEHLEIEIKKILQLSKYFKDKVAKWPKEYSSKKEYKFKAPKNKK